MITHAPLRTLFVLNSLNAGGAEKQVLSLLRNLDHSRFTSALVYLRRHEQLLPQIPECIERVHCSDSRSYIDVSAIRRLATFIDEFRPELIACTNPWSLLNVALARMCTRHSFRVIEVFHTTGIRSLKQRLQLQLYRRLFAQCDSLVYVCENQRRFWRQHGLRGRRDWVIHNGVDLQHFHDSGWDDQREHIRARHGFAAGDLVIGLCAALRPEKAHGDLLHLVSRLRNAGIPARALLIGEGPQRSTIESMVRELELTAHVHITGFQTDVRPFIAACDVMMLMSHSIETFSIAALEAMAMGKPMVMTDVGGADEQVTPGKTGFLFRPGDVDEALTHVLRLTDPTVRQTFGNAAAADVRNRFSLEQMVRAYEDHFEDVCGVRRLERAA
jgi:glycosyltransferase involved in cell wall biosynthesis